MLNNPRFPKKMGAVRLNLLRDFALQKMQVCNVSFLRHRDRRTGGTTTVRALVAVRQLASDIATELASGMFESGSAPMFLPPTFTELKACRPVVLEPDLPREPGRGPLHYQ